MEAVIQSDLGSLSSVSAPRFCESLIGNVKQQVNVQFEGGKWNVFPKSLSTEKLNESVCWVPDITFKYFQQESYFEIVDIFKEKHTLKRGSTRDDNYTRVG